MEVRKICKKLPVPVSSEEAVVLSDLECIYNIANHYENAKYLMENDIISYLVDVYVSDTHGKSKALQILKVMAFYWKSKVWLNDSTFRKLFSKMSKEFHDDCFNVELCRSITTILFDHPFCNMQGEEWTVILLNAFEKIARLEVSSEFRDLAIKLASLMVEKFVFQVKNGTKEYEACIFLIQMLSVQIRLLIQNRGIEGIIKKDVYLIKTCFHNFVKLIPYMVDDYLLHLHYQYVEQLKISIRSVNRTVINFLLQTFVEWHPEDYCSEISLMVLLHSSFQMLCAWLIKETEIFKDEVREVLRSILILCTDYLMMVQAKETSVLFVHYYHVDFMKVFICQFCKLNDNVPSAVLSELELHEVLLKYLYFQWEHYLQDGCKEYEEILCKICTVILNIVVYEKKIVAHSEAFYKLLNFLLDKVPLLSYKFENLSLRINFLVLGLLIATIFFKRIDQCKASFIRFLNLGIAVLFASHHVERYGNSKVFVLCGEYRYIWPEVVDLWFLGMQALCTVISLIPWTSNILMESGWPQDILESFALVGVEAIETNVKYSYQALLSVLARINKNVIEEFNKLDARTVCSRHKLKELEAEIL